MKAMIFAAGLGTRLRPLTDTMPKALVPVGGTPLLEILMKKMIASGVSDVVINIHHFGEQIVDFIEQNRSFGINVQFSDERTELLETGGGIKYAAPLLTAGSTQNEHFLIHNVDILSNLDLGAFYKSCRPDAAAMLVVSCRETQRYLLFNEEDRLVGWTNIKTGEVKSPYPNLDVGKCKRYAFAGIHLISSHLFPHFDKWGSKFSIIEFYLSVCHEEPIYAHICTDLKLMDVGKQDTLSKAESFVKEM